MANYLLTSSDFGIGYELTPCNQRVVRAYEKETGNESVLFQTDWDFPLLARNLGWNMKVKRGDKCNHNSTDGTVTCRECGATASDFIDAARQWLDKHEGHTFRSRYDLLGGYFALD